jgi:hypothetical protein
MLADASSKPTIGSSAVSTGPRNAFATRIADEAAAVRDTLKSFAEIGGSLLDAQDDGQPLDGHRDRAWLGRLQNPCRHGLQR